MSTGKILEKHICPLCDKKMYIFDEFNTQEYNIKLYRCKKCVLELNEYSKESQVISDKCFVASYDGDIIKNF